MEGDAAETPVPETGSVGDKLREAREALGLQLSDIAARTRIPLRHLMAIEASDFSGMPSSTYAIGFAKTYARAVGVDEEDVARQLRGLLHHETVRQPVHNFTFEEAPVRTPPPILAWGVGAVALIVVIGMILFYATDLFRGSTPPSESLPMPTVSPTVAAAPAPEPANAGQVSLVAVDRVWVRVNDGQGARIFEKEMQPGERYDVPAELAGAVVRTARADAVRVMLNGSDVGPLGNAYQTVELPITADAVRARQTGQTPGAAPSSPAAAATAPVEPAMRGNGAPSRPAPRPASRPTPRPTQQGAPAPVAPAVPAADGGPAPVAETTP